MVLGEWMGWNGADFSAYDDTMDMTTLLSLEKFGAIQCIICAELDAVRIENAYRL
jgi:hypothetical protein